MKALKKKTFAVIMLICIAGFVNAQFYKDMRIGLNAGAYIYQGDLTPERFGAFRTPSFGINIFAKKPLNNFLSARLNISIAKLRADESMYSKPEWRQQRNFAFTTPVKEFTGLLEWNIKGANYDDLGFMPYVFAGAGISFINSRPDYSRMNSTVFFEGSTVQTGLVTDIAHGTPGAIAVLPVGIGFEKSISDRLSFNLESTYRFLFTDYLDGFRYASNPKKGDNYHSTSAGIIYKFGNKGNGNGTGCPVLKY